MTPVVVVVEGPAGIGKTTRWLAAVDDARRRGYRVLLARPAEAEQQLSYVALTDLLGGVEAEVLATLPEPQRRAVERTPFS